ncbi:SGNH/GDSL hydrolase family protein [Xanthobacter sp. V3C-3]|uniref:SGNH/GDSL hydrolase family protein n=1 Tax=Xanthobacter lutulentifluminis TaxID=3119935 RepID=UPI003727C85F
MSMTVRIRSARPSLRRGLLSCALAASLLLAGMPGAMACPASGRPSPLVLTKGAKALREGAPLRILAIGSSSTAGAGASSADANYPSQLARRLETAFGPGRVEITNAGVSGETGPGTLRRLQSFMANPPAPDLVIWQVGTNDVIFGGDPASLRQLVTTGLDAIKATGAAALVIDQQYFPGIGNAERYEAFVAAVDGAAAARGASVMQRYRMMKQWAAQDPQGFKASLAWDSFHQGDKGYACLAELIAPAIVSGVAAAGGSSAKPKAAPSPRADAGAPLR